MVRENVPSGRCLGLSGSSLAAYGLTWNPQPSDEQKRVCKTQSYLSFIYTQDCTWRYNFLCFGPQVLTWLVNLNSQMLIFKTILLDYFLSSIFSGLRGVAGLQLSNAFTDLTSSSLSFRLANSLYGSLKENGHCETNFSHRNMSNMK